MPVSKKDRKARKKARGKTHPYGRAGDPMMAVDKDGSSEEDAPKDVTRGHILQRHKTEYRQLRDKVEQMKKDRKKLSKRDLSQKAQKKSITKEIQQLQAELAAKHKQELDDFDRGVIEKKMEASATPLPVIPLAPTAAAAMPFQFKFGNFTAAPSTSVQDLLPPAAPVDLSTLQFKS